MPSANLESHVTVFADPGTPSLPLLKYIDWKRSQTGLSFDEVFSERVTLAPGETYVFQSSMGGTIVGDPVDILPAAGKPTWYQFFDTDAFSGHVTSIGSVAASYQFIPQADGTIVVLSTHFSTLVAGQSVYFSGSDYGEAGPWASANQGMWQVVSATPTQAVFMRIDPVDPVGVAETVACVTADDIQVNIALALPRFAMIWASTGNARVFSGLKKILAVTKNWFAIATESTFFPMTLGGPAFTWLYLTPDYLNFIRVEVDQQALVIINTGGAPAQETIILPQAIPVDPPVGWMESLGFAVGLTVTNASAVPLTANVIYAFGE